MKEETRIVPSTQTTNFRVTRARAAAFRTSGEILPLKLPTHEDRKRKLRTNKKRVASNENNSICSAAECVLPKKRRALKDVSNVSCENSYRNCIDSVKNQIKNNKPIGIQVKVSKVSTSSVGNIEHQATKVIHEGKIDNVSEEDKDENESLHLNSESNTRAITLSTCQFGKQNFAASWPESFLKKAENIDSIGKLVISNNSQVKDIDFGHTFPQMCSTYASQIYENFRVAELFRRPSPMFMETIQKDVTDGMRRVLVDWLVEVSEEYKLVPDTLYLTVLFIDFFLSLESIGRWRLQLLGITCMMIASKYEEMCAPRVAEFCFITDNTYSKTEVLEMEKQVLKTCDFRLGLPTTKTFLRRFLRAAQATLKCHSFVLEYLSNYLAELTLLEYSFIKYLPSVIAAAAVFLAKWTLNQTEHPWNATLEHYTTYVASDLASAVLELQELQLNTKGCPLNAIRAKYKQKKFERVALLSSPKLHPTLFQTKKASSF